MPAAGDMNRHAEKACRLSNTTHWDAAPSVPLASLPLFCGAVDPDISLFEERRWLDRPEILANASKIADLLRGTDVSYLTLRNDETPAAQTCTEALTLYNEVLRCNSEAFEYCIPGFIEELSGHDVEYEKKPFEPNIPAFSRTQRTDERTVKDHLNSELANIAQASFPSRKPKVRTGRDAVSSSDAQDLAECQEVTIRGFCDVLEDFCGRAETANDELDEVDGPPFHLADIKLLANELMSPRAQKVLHLVPVDTLVRLLNVLDRQIRHGQVLSVDENESADSDVVSSVMSALESIHAALTIMTHHDMPKQLYKEEMIERILDCSRHHIMETMFACDPSYRALHKPRETGASDGEEDDAEVGSSGKRRRSFRSVRPRKSIGNKVSAAIYSVLQKLCTILGLLKDLLSIEKLPDSCILQLVKTSFTTFMVDNIQILQLKAINLICGVFALYTQHKNFLIDETFQLLWKVPFSKRALRAYHLPDEEQRPIQMITALLIQIVQCSPGLPETLELTLAATPVSELSFDATCPAKCLDTATESCCLFWTRVVQRFTTSKTQTQTQDLSELKVIMENIVTDLLMTLNLPEYPASALLLEVLCVLLLQNAGLKSKDISARCMAVDLLGTIAARLKHDAVSCNRNKFWILQELKHENPDHPTDQCKAVCFICFNAGNQKQLIICKDCERRFHADCLGVISQDDMSHSWLCHFCLCKRQLEVLGTYCKSLSNGGNKEIQESNLETPDSISRLEIIQQLLLNFLQEAGSSDDVHLFARWFYLCQWHKDDPISSEKFIYYFARLKSKAIVRDFGTSSSLLPRESAKRISLELSQNNSFSRGYDKILYVLLASLRENSPILRAKALRASAVEGRFCDSAISVREAALELVGRYIASHPDVGLKYFEKVAERIKDTGVSVRKRAIRIIRDMCISNPNFSEFTNGCIEIISRVYDEEASVQDLVSKTFFEFWFEEPSEPQIQYFGDGSHVPLEVARKTEQIVEMLRRMPNHQLLVTVIRRNLSLDFLPQSAKANGINPVALATVRKRCELMCRCLLERILQVEEATNQEIEVLALPYVLALHAFCVVDPMLCAPASDPSQFVVTLQPYLKSQADNRSVAQLLESIIFVIDAVLPLRKPAHSIVEELEQDLKQMIFRHSFLTVVHACIRCLCSLSKIAGKGASVVENLIQVFFKHLDSLGIDNKQQVGRSLFCLGLLIRYGHELMMGRGSHDIQVVKCLTLLKNYLDTDDFSIKLRALQSLGSVLIARPEYMLEKDIGNLVHMALSSESEPLIKIQELQNLHDYLVDTESKMGTDHAIESGTHAPESTRVPVAAGAGDTNICGGIIQLYWNNILERCLDVNDQVRQYAVKIIEIVLRQGLVHPITSVPYLIALETDPQEANSKLAHHLLVNMNEKYPAFFESRLGDGLQMSFGFIESFLRQNKLPGTSKGKSDGNIFTYAKIGISRIYRLIRGNRMSRNKFMSSVIRKFDPGSWNKSMVSFLIYCTEILASLPFTTPDEPLYLIYTINRVVQVKAGAIESEMKALISRSVQGESTKSSHENGAVQLELGDCNGRESAYGNGMCFNDTSGISGEDLLKFQGTCLAAIALQLLLKLKRHLKIVYSLNDARCQAYSSNEPLKPGEVLSKQSIPFGINENLINLPSTYNDMIVKYQEFKASLREDTVDYSTFTASIKRKRPAPRSGKSTQGMGDEGDGVDYDDWSGGSRQFSGSARKGYSSRGRQRL
ncbi:sister chromatid cohesion protein SCC2 isoform X2 [Aristolochia californica]|uniref:sister chromatid cohesion protein SCC2 isoform X2 n=1 Tax=Aristolochia californica TaxID=171875 RepID=UPI0035D690F8